jgi:hypothetical protein
MLKKKRMIISKTKIQHFTIDWSGPKLCQSKNKSELEHVQERSEKCVKIKKNIYLKMHSLQNVCPKVKINTNVSLSICKITGLQKEIQITACCGYRLIEQALTERTHKIIFG